MKFKSKAITSRESALEGLSQRESLECSRLLDDGSKSSSNFSLFNFFCPMTKTGSFQKNRKFDSNIESLNFFSKRTKSGIMALLLLLVTGILTYLSFILRNHDSSSASFSKPILAYEKRPQNLKFDQQINRLFFKGLRENKEMPPLEGANIITLEMVDKRVSQDNQAFSVTVTLFASESDSSSPIATLSELSSSKSLLLPSAYYVLEYKIDFPSHPNLSYFVYRGLLLTETVYQRVILDDSIMEEINQISENNTSGNYDKHYLVSLDENLSRNNKYVFKGFFSCELSSKENGSCPFGSYLPTKNLFKLSLKNDDKISLKPAYDLMVGILGHERHSRSLQSLDPSFMVEMPGPKENFDSRAREKTDIVITINPTKAEKKEEPSSNSAQDSPTPEISEKSVEAASIPPLERPPLEIRDKIVTSTIKATRHRARQGQFWTVLSYDKYTFVVVDDGKHFAREVHLQGENNQLEASFIKIGQTGNHHARVVFRDGFSILLPSDFFNQIIELKEKPFENDDEVPTRKILYELGFSMDGSFAGVSDARVYIPYDRRSTNFVDKIDKAKDKLFMALSTCENCYVKTARPIDNFYLKKKYNSREEVLLNVDFYLKRYLENKEALPFFCLKGAEDCNPKKTDFLVMVEGKEHYILIGKVARYRHLTLMNAPLGVLIDPVRARKTFRNSLQLSFTLDDGSVLTLTEKEIRKLKFAQENDRMPEGFKNRELKVEEQKEAVEQSELSTSNEIEAHKEEVESEKKEESPKQENENTPIFSFLNIKTEDPPLISYIVEKGRRISINRQAINKMVEVSKTSPLFSFAVDTAPNFPIYHNKYTVIPYQCLEQFVQKGVNVFEELSMTESKKIGQSIISEHNGVVKRLYINVPLIVQHIEDKNKAGPNPPQPTGEEEKRGFEVLESCGARVLPVKSSALSLMTPETESEANDAAALTHPHLSPALLAISKHSPKLALTVNNLSYLKHRLGHLVFTTVTKQDPPKRDGSIKVEIDGKKYWVDLDMIQDIRKSSKQNGHVIEEILKKDQEYSEERVKELEELEFDKDLFRSVIDKNYNKKDQGQREAYDLYTDYFILNLEDKYDPQSANNKANNEDKLGEMLEQVNMKGLSSKKIEDLSEEEKKQQAELNQQAKQTWTKEKNPLASGLDGKDDKNTSMDSYGNDNTVAWRKMEKDKRDKARRESIKNIIDNNQISEIQLGYLLIKFQGELFEKKVDGKVEEIPPQNQNLKESEEEKQPEAPPPTTENSQPENTNPLPQEEVPEEQQSAEEQNKPEEAPETPQARLLSEEEDETSSENDILDEEPTLNAEVPPPAHYPYLDPELSPPTLLTGPSVSYVLKEDKLKEKVADSSDRGFALIDLIFDEHLNELNEGQIETLRNVAVIENELDLNNKYIDFEDIRKLDIFKYLDYTDYNEAKKKEEEKEAERKSFEKASADISKEKAEEAKKKLEEMPEDISIDTLASEPAPKGTFVVGEPKPFEEACDGLVWQDKCYGYWNGYLELQNKQAVEANCLGVFDPKNTKCEGVITGNVVECAYEDGKCKEAYFYSEFGDGNGTFSNRIFEGPIDYEIILSTTRKLEVHCEGPYNGSVCQGPSQIKIWYGEMSGQANCSGPLVDSVCVSGLSLFYGNNSLGRGGVRVDGVAITCDKKFDFETEYCSSSYSKVICMGDFVSTKTSYFCVGPTQKVSLDKFLGEPSPPPSERICESYYSNQECKEVTVSSDKECTGYYTGENNRKCEGRFTDYANDTGSVCEGAFDSEDRACEGVYTSTEGVCNGKGVLDRSCSGQFSLSKGKAVFECHGEYNYDTDTCDGLQKQLLAKKPSAFCLGKSKIGYVHNCDGSDSTLVRLNPISANAFKGAYTWIDKKNHGDGLRCNGFVIPYSEDNTFYCVGKLSFVPGEGSPNPPFECMIWDRDHCLPEIPESAHLKKPAAKD